MINKKISLEHLSLVLKFTLDLVDLLQENFERFSAVHDEKQKKKSCFSSLRNVIRGCHFFFNFFKVGLKKIEKSCFKFYIIYLLAPWKLESKVVS